VNWEPDLVPGQPLYLYGSGYPGGRIINYAAFAPTPIGVEGDSPGNVVRGFDALQVDMSLRRDFYVSERLKLQFRTEASNVFNHPQFGYIYPTVLDGPDLFGWAQGSLANAGSALSPIYESGGPRSLELALKLRF